MQRGIQGTWVRCTTTPEPFSAFVPSPLPPRPALLFEPPMDLLSRGTDPLPR
jgi:hypothetical protein